MNADTGKVLQNYTGGKGKKTQFEFATEMQYGNQGTTSTQLYADTVITLSAPDLSFGKGRRKVNAVMSEILSLQLVLSSSISNFDLSKSVLIISYDYAIMGLWF
jgi:hypothetical protein